jgi:hypothetical protein
VTTMETTVNASSELPGLVIRVGGADTVVARRTYTIAP